MVGVQGDKVAENFRTLAFKITYFRAKYITFSSQNHIYFGYKLTPPSFGILNFMKKGETALFLCSRENFDSTTT